jgi:hypothetical protein
VPEFDIDAVVLEHTRTRAQYLHMAASDQNNAFSVSFRHASPTLHCLGSGNFFEFRIHRWKFGFIIRDAPGTDFAGYPADIKAGYRIFLSP